MVEVFPDNNIQGVNFFGHPGYVFDASTRRISGGYRFFMHDYFSGTTGVRHGIHMENFNNGDILADPSSIGSDGFFTVTQHHGN